VGAEVRGRGGLHLGGLPRLHGEAVDSGGHGVGEGAGPPQGGGGGGDVAGGLVPGKVAGQVTAELLAFAEVGGEAELVEGLWGGEGGGGGLGDVVAHYWHSVDTLASIEPPVELFVSAHDDVDVWSCGRQLSKAIVLADEI